MTTCTALIIPANQNEPARVETIDAGLTNLQTLVAGNIEAVSADDWHFYLNEGGKILHLAPNRRAALLVIESNRSPDRGVLRERRDPGRDRGRGRGRRARAPDRPRTATLRTAPASKLSRT
jgi:hypothetical protein